MALGSAKAPFSHPDWLFELKYDGFRALAHIDGKRTQLVSRNGHPFASFSDLGHAIAAALPYTQRAVLDGEIVCLDRKGRPQFKDLLFRRGVPCFFAFDLLYDGKDRRRDAVVERKLELRRMIGRFSRTSRLRYADHIWKRAQSFFAMSVSWILKGLWRNPNTRLMKENRHEVAGTRSRIAAIRRWLVDMNCSSERDIWSLCPVGTPVL